MLPELRTDIPGPESRRLAAELRRHESRNVTFISPEFPVFWERAHGANVWDVDGNRFLDLTSAFAVSGLGHGPASVLIALHAQADRLLHAMGDVHPTREKVALCRRLSEITFERWGAGEARTILACSGSDAIEAALKTSLLHRGRPGVISFSGGYHGLGHGALAVSGLPYFQTPFVPQLGRFGVTFPYPTCAHCPFGCDTPERLGLPFPTCSADCLDRLRAELDATLRSQPIGAILVEPVQGRGGDIVPPTAFLPMLRELADAHDVLLILDEIYTGFHRTGRLFACEHSGVVPDLICLGKGLTSGFPLSACVGRAAIMDAWPESAGEALHTSTFLGHPVGCAMALASIDEHLQPHTATTVARTAELWTTHLSRLQAPNLGDVRGIGLMRGLEIIHATGAPHPALAGAIVTAALRDGLLLLAGGPHGNVLSLAPAFHGTAEEIAFAGGRIQEYLTSLPGSIS